MGPLDCAVIKTGSRSQRARSAQFAHNSIVLFIHLVTFSIHTAQSGLLRGVDLNVLTKCVAVLRGGSGAHQIVVKAFISAVVLPVTFGGFCQNQTADQ